MKFSTVAVLALIGSISAVRLTDNLWNDDDDEQSTLDSIKLAEKLHKTTFTGLDRNAQHDLLDEKSHMVFEGDNFVQNKKRTTFAEPTKDEFEAMNI